MKNKNIFLHIGLPKTGTTSIQNTLQYMQNCGILSEKNFQYHNHNKMFSLLQENLCFPDDEKIFSEKLNAELKIYVNDNIEEIKDNIIFSQEGFSLDAVDDYRVVSTARVKKFYNVFKEFNIKVIIYLRRQDIFLESLYAQWAKTGMLTKEKMLKDDLKKSLFFKKHLDDYTELFGKQNVIVRIFEKDALLNGDVVSDFLQTVGLKNITLPDIPQREKNYSLSPEALRIRIAFDEKFRMSISEQEKYIKELDKKYLNGELDKILYVFRKNYSNSGQNVEMISKYSQLNQLLCLEKIGSFSNTGFMEPDERREFLALYEEDNAAIAREYLGREDGKLFNDVFPENIISLNEPSTTDLTTIFLPIFNNLHLRLQHVENRFENVERRLKYIKYPWKFVFMLVKEVYYKIKNIF